MPILSIRSEGAFVKFFKNMKMTYAAAIAAIVGILVLIACNRKKPQTIEETTTEKIEESTVVKERAVEPVVETPKSDPIVALLLSIKKTPCFGKCPVFEIKVFSDGVVNYIGKKNVEKIGVYEANIGAEAAKILIADIENLGYFSLAENYPNNGQKIDDLPNTVTFVKNKTASHTITNNHHAPRNLNQIENLLLQKLEVLEYASID